MDYSAARTCTDSSRNKDSFDGMIPEDRLADPEAYRDGKHFFEGECRKGSSDQIVMDKKVQTVDKYLSGRSLAEKTHTAGRGKCIEPCSCVKGFNP